jgi:hypothetical protein
MKNKTILTAGLLCSLAIAPAFASSNETVQHVPGIFVGFTDAEGETEFSYGLEYEYKFSKQWGAGIVYEKTDKAHHEDGVEVKLAAIYLHPWKNLRLGAGAGKEEIGGHHPHTEDLYRASVSYDFHLGDFGIAPTLAIDFVDGETATVFGIAIVRPF